MFVICGVILLAIIMLLLSSGEGRPPVIVCNSVSCKHNKLCRCMRKNIAVYDNTVTGLCLNHTDSMKDRVLEPIRRTRLIERYEHDIATADILKKAKEDFEEEELLNNPDAFDRWMRRKGRFKKS